jgi:hypothetical protein
VEVHPAPETAGRIAVIVPAPLTVTVNGPGAVPQVMLLTVIVGWVVAE